MHLDEIVWGGQRFLGQSTDRLANGQLIALLSLGKVQL